MGSNKSNVLSIVSLDINTFYTILPSISELMTYFFHQINIVRRNRNGIRVSCKNVNTGSLQFQLNNNNFEMSHFDANKTSDSI